MSENIEKAAVKDEPKTAPVKAAKADKAQKPEKKKKEKKPAKRPLKEMFQELKKVTWPTKKELLTYSVCVVVFVVVCTLLLALIDLGVSALVRFISGTGDSALPTLISKLFG